jgi:hypothetical protein
MLSCRGIGDNHPEPSGFVHGNIIGTTAAAENCATTRQHPEDLRAENTPAPQKPNDIGILSHLQEFFGGLAFLDEKVYALPLELLWNPVWDGNFIQMDKRHFEWFHFVSLSPSFQFADFYPPYLLILNLKCPDLRSLRVFQGDNKIRTIRIERFLNVGRRRIGFRRWMRMINTQVSVSCCTKSPEEFEQF